MHAARNKDDFVGVCKWKHATTGRRSKSQWAAQVWLPDGSELLDGPHSTPQAAAEAHDRLALQHRPECAF